MQVKSPVAPPLRLVGIRSCAQVIAATRGTSEAEKKSVRDGIMRNTNSNEPAPCGCRSHNHYSYSINIP